MKQDGSIVFLSSDIFVWFWYLNDTTLIEWVGFPPLLFGKVFEELLLIVSAFGIIRKWNHLELGFLAKSFLAIDSVFYLVIGIIWLSVISSVNFHSSNLFLWNCLFYLSKLIFWHQISYNFFISVWSGTISPFSLLILVAWVFPFLF